MTDQRNKRGKEESHEFKKKNHADLTKRENRSLLVPFRGSGEKKGSIGNKP